MALLKRKVVHGSSQVDRTAQGFPRSPTNSTRCLKARSAGRSGCATRLIQKFRRVQHSLKVASRVRHAENSVSHLKRTTSSCRCLVAILPLQVVMCRPSLLRSIPSTLAISMHASQVRSCDCGLIRKIRGWRQLPQVNSMNSARHGLHRWATCSVIARSFSPGARLVVVSRTSTDFATQTASR